MSIDSTSGREGEVVAWLDRYLAEHGWRTLRIPVSPGRDDVYATVVDAPLVTLTTHLDTVPPFIPPRRDGETLYGRGACDAKGIAAVDDLRRRAPARRARADRAVVRRRRRGHPRRRARGERGDRVGARPGDESRRDRWRADARARSPSAPRARFASRFARAATPRTRPIRTSATRRRATSCICSPRSTRSPFRRDELFGETTVNIGVLTGGVADNVVAPCGRGAADDSAGHAARRT